MDPSSDQQARSRERNAARVSLIKRRIVAASVVAFGAVAGLSARHSLGASHAAQASARRPAVPARAGPTATAQSFFDERDAGAYSFDDETPITPSSGATSAPQPVPAAPPVVQSSVS